MTAAPPIVITRWTSQAGRRRAALEPGYVKIDESAVWPDWLNNLIAPASSAPQVPSTPPAAGAQG